MAQPQPPGPKGDADPSMDEILASIRRILSDEDKAAQEKAANDAVLMLDPSMMIDDNTPLDPLAPHPPAPAGAHAPTPFPRLPPEPEPAPSAPPPLSLAAPDPRPPLPQPSMPTAAEPLIAPEAAAAAASSVGALVRLAAERSVPVHRGGPTIEDMVREELRPLLKTWLDTHLPPVVERLVRSEIERVIGRVGG